MNARDLDVAVRLLVRAAAIESRRPELARLDRMLARAIVGSLADLALGVDGQIKSAIERYSDRRPMDRSIARTLTHSG